MLENHRRHRFNDLLTIRATRELREAIDVAARRSITTPSSYARAALLTALRRDGVEIEFGAETKAA
jgi:hypothetical protein